MSRTIKSPFRPTGPPMGQPLASMFKPSVLLAAALVVGVPAAALAQNATPPAPATQAADKSSTGGARATAGAPTSADQSSASTPPQPGSANSGSTDAAQPAAAGATGTPSKPDPVCFKLTGRCVEGSKTPPATKGSTAAAKNGTAAKDHLNLTAPDVRSVVPAEELKEPLATNEQVVEAQEDATVSVKTESIVPPDVPLGFGAIWWALNHPSQAWRIVTPAE